MPENARSGCGHFCRFASIIDFLGSPQAGGASSKNRRKFADFGRSALISASTTGRALLVRKGSSPVGNTSGRLFPRRRNSAGSNPVATVWCGFCNWELVPLRLSSLRCRLRRQVFAGGFECLGWLEWARLSVRPAHLERVTHYWLERVPAQLGTRLEGYFHDVETASVRILSRQVGVVFVIGNWSLSPSLLCVVAIFSGAL